MVKLHQLKTMLSSLSSSVPHPHANQQTTIRAETSKIFPPQMATTTTRCNPHKYTLVLYTRAHTHPYTHSYTNAHTPTTQIFTYPHTQPINPFLRACPSSSAPVKPCQTLPCHLVLWEISGSNPGEDDSWGKVGSLGR